ncbi:MAG: membrane dipeptidase [Halieaceae bacterium]|jgi:microsomal dipeptidase-like Zn-dependent dipeptidase|nr:membrane dipeptidase [Halieaceae bacterium]
MNRILKTVAGIAGAAMVLGVIYFFTLAPRHFDRLSNSVDRSIPLPEVSAAARALHQQLFIADLHADPLLWRRDLTEELSHGAVDLPRLLAGNVGLQVFGSVTKTPRGQNYESNPSDSDVLTYLVIGNLQPVATWTSLYERAIFHVGKLEDLQQRSGGQLKIIRNQDDLAMLVAAREQGQPLVGGLLALEGAQPLEGRLDNLQRLFDAGYRMIGLAHFFDNEVAGSMHGEEKYGLTALGRQVVERAEAMGMVIDLAHASPAAVSDVFDMATRPLVVSHGGVRAVCDANRNLTDVQLHRLAANGGVIGIGYWEAAVCDSSPAGIVAAMNHVRDTIGIQHIALGSDFDGAVTTRFDTSELAVLTQALMDAGYSDADIRAVMGGNVLRVLGQTLP